MAMICVKAAKCKGFTAMRGNYQKSSGARGRGRVSASVADFAENG